VVNFGQLPYTHPDSISLFNGEKIKCKSSSVKRAAPDLYSYRPSLYQNLDMYRQYDLVH